MSPSPSNNLNVWMDKEVLRAFDHLRTQLGMNRKSLVELVLRRAVILLNSGEWKIDEMKEDYDQWVQGRPPPTQLEKRRRRLRDG